MLPYQEACLPANNEPPELLKQASSANEPCLLLCFDPQLDIMIKLQLTAC